MDSCCTTTYGGLITLMDSEDVLDEYSNVSSTVSKYEISIFSKDTVEESEEPLLSHTSLNQ